MGGESPVKLPLSEDSSLSRGAGGANHNRSILLGQVSNRGRSEVEVASFERTQDNCVGDIASGGNPVPFDIEHTGDNAEVFWREGIVR